MVKKKLHPIAKAMNFKSNKEFYDSFPTKESYDQHMAQQNTLQPQNMGDGGKLQSGFFPTNTNVPYNQRGADSTDFSQLLVSNPQMAAYIYNQYKQLVTDPKSNVKENAQQVLNAYDAALKGKKMANGGVTQQMRDNYESAMGYMNQQGYNLHDPKLRHDPNIGAQYFNNYNASVSATPDKQFNTRDLPAMQSYFQANKGTGAVRNTDPMGFSKVDNWAGNQTLNSRQMTYQTQNNNGPVIDYGTNAQAAQSVASSWKDKNMNTGWEGFGDPKSDINYKAPVQSTWQSNDQGIPMAQVQPQKSNWHTNDNTDYSLDAVREVGKGGKIHIKPQNKGKFTAYKKRTGKTTEEALHSKDPHVRQMANFARNAKKWHHADGGLIYMDNGDLVTPDNPIQGATQLDGPQAIQYTSQPNAPQIQGNPYLGRDMMDQSDITYPQPNIERSLANRSHSNMAPIGINLNTAPLIAGADALVTSAIYNPHMRANEANLYRKNMQQVQSPNNYNGGEMLNYDQGGNIIDNYKVNPYGAKEMIEGGEYVQLPNGKGATAQGDKHYMASGGIPTDLPPESRVYSDQLKADKSFVSDITDGKINRKMTVADIAKKFDSKKESKIIDNPMSDPISKRTATLNKKRKDGLLDQVFNYQEDILKNPQGTVMQDLGMAYGGRVMDMGGNTDIIRQKQLQLLQDKPEGVVAANNIYGLSNQPFNFADGIYGPRTKYVEDWQPSGGKLDTLPLRPLGDQMSPQIPQVSQDTDSVPSTQDEANRGPYDNPNIDSTGNNQINVPNTTQKIAKKGNNSFGSQYGGFGSGFLPQLTATINALTDYPVRSSKYQPEYIGRQEGLNIDPALNRNLAISKLSQSNSGNAGIDSARGLQGLASNQEADNQLYGQKFNYDANQEFRRRVGNTEIKNQAEQVNLQRMDNTWNQMTQRKANKDAAIQEVANASSKAYTNSRKALYDKNNQQLLGQLFGNEQYKQGKGYQFVDDGSGTYHISPLSTGSGDDSGYKTITTETTDNKGNIKRKVSKVPKKKNDEDN